MLPCLAITFCALISNFQKAKCDILSEKPIYKALELGSGEDPGSKQVVRQEALSNYLEYSRVLGNPVTSYSPNRPRAVFLSHLDISNAAWKCSCDGVG